MKQRLYALFLLTTVLRIVGDAIEGVSLPWHLLNKTNSLLSIAGYSLASMLPWVIFPPLIGNFLDRTEKKVRLAFLALFAQSFLAITLVRFAQDVRIFYLLISLISALDTLHRYYGFSLIAFMTLEESELQKLNAKVQTIGGVTSLFSFPIMGYLAYLFGIKLMLLDALFLLIGALLLVPYINVSVRRGESRKEKECLKIEISRKIVFAGIILILTFNFAIASARIFIFNALRTLAKGEVLYGLLRSLGTLGSLISAFGIVFIAHKFRIGILKPLVIGMMLESLAVLFLGFSLLPLLLAGVLLLSFGGEILNISFDSLFQKVIPLERLGTYRGVFDALATLIIPISQLTFAWLIEKGFNVPMLAFIAFGAGIIATLGFYVIVSDVIG
ncbi:MFS transporter [Pyrococcus abyssi]|nr:MFS transporter [Pyrococcus abyssi]